MAGIETNFAVPNVVSRALGGGTIIDFDSDSQTVNSLGPQSVGYDLKRSLCFEESDSSNDDAHGNEDNKGSKTRKCMTLTDVAVFHGQIESNALSTTYGRKV